MKNKYQEALDKLKHIESEHNARTGHPCSDILQELVDKETPIKATKDKEADCFGRIWFRCPKCTLCVLGYDKYCVTCGQKLDWSDE